MITIIHSRYFIHCYITREASCCQNEFVTPLTKQTTLLLVLIAHLSKGLGHETGSKYFKFKFKLWVYIRASTIF
jgi:hypothetical protein